MKGTPTTQLTKPSSQFLRDIGDLDPDKEINVSASKELYTEAAVNSLRGDDSEALSFLSKFDKQVETINSQIQSYVATLKSFYSGGVSYSFYRDAAQHLRSNSRDEWLNAEHRAFRRVVGEDPVGLSTDTENLPEELRVRQALLPTPVEQISFFQRIRSSAYYAQFYSTFTTIQEISRWPTIYMMLFNSALTNNLSVTHSAHLFMGDLDLGLERDSSQTILQLT